MNKKRLIPVIYLKNGFIVRSEKFHSHKIIGNIINEIRRYNEWDIDELVFIDISREKIYDSRRNDHKIQKVSSFDEIIDLVSKECFMPLSFGGGIRNLSQIKKLFDRGADKVILNKILFTRPDIVKKAVNIFGSSSIIGSVDYKFRDDLSFYTDYGMNKVNLDFAEILSLINELKIGELLINDIDRDGTGEGYNIEVVQNFVESLEIPVIACGGAASVFDFKELAEIEGISGIAAGNMFHFTENSYPRAKKELKNQNYNFR